MRRAIVATLSVSLLVTPMLAGAVRFPDVPGDHPYNSSVEALAIEGVVTGNPDGNFYPARPVNRAEFLTMLYRATKKTARSASVSCFSDVQAAAWYANVVCDAVAEGYVNGYPDGSFKPEQTVNRPEALKMLFKTFGLGVLTGDDAAAAAGDFTDVSPNSWYVGYVTSSYRNGLLPVPGYPTSGKFYPANALLRGEAAAYVWRAMNITGDFEPLPGEETSSASSVDESSASSAASSVSSKSSSKSSSKFSSSRSTSTTMQVDFPFSDGGDVAGRAKMVYTFPLKAATDVEVSAKLGTGTEKSVSCRLYLLGENGLSNEYYIGYQSEATCRLKLSLPKGDYQLEVRPEDPNATFTLVTKSTKSDGNDGFDEALLLEPRKSKAGQLAVSDYADWYTFSFAMNGKHTVQTFGEDVTCYIYPLANVDLFGDTSPTCGAEYDFPKGSYIVQVARKNGTSAPLNYSVQLD